MILQFGEWLPDQPDFGNSCITATNVIPLENGYGPMAGPTVLTSTLGADPKGVISFRRVNGAHETFAGTETGLFRLIGSVWDEVTKTGGYSSATFWRFAQYGDRVVATNGEDNPQKFDFGIDQKFSDLPNAPKCRSFMVVRDVLVALDVLDTSGDEVSFSAVNNSESWTTLTGGGGQSFPDGGPVIGGVGGEFGVILQEDGITRMDFVGGDLRFTFDKVEGAIGCIDGASIVGYKGGVFYLSSEGFQVFDGAQSRNISSGKTTTTFNAAYSAPRVTDADDTRVTDTGDVRVVSEPNTVQGALDPENSLVIWSYPTATANKLLLYNYRIDKWAESDQDLSQAHSAFRAAGTRLGGFDTSNRLVIMDGTDLSATLSTGIVQASRDRSSFVSAVRGLVDSAHDITVGKRTALSDTETTVTGSSNSNGKVSVRSHGRYHRFELTPTETFTEATGVDVEVKRSGAKV